MRNRRIWFATLVIVCGAVLAAAPALRAGGETVNWVDIAKIKAEGMQRSQAMELCSWLSDVYAPRLTGSPTAQKAADWVVGKLKDYGLVNVKIEPWVNRNGFERGWTNDRFYLAATAPERFAIPGTPAAWTPGTSGPVSGEVALVAATNEEELAAYKGKLKGKWVLVQAAPDVPAMWASQSRRYSADELATIELSPAQGGEFGMALPGGRGGAPGQPPTAFRAGQAFANARSEFLRAEGALGTLATIPRGHGIYTISGNRAADPEKTLPAVSIAAEQYGRLARMVAKGVPVTVEADIKNTFYPTPAVFNVVGEIPGTDKADEVVMLGAHIDTWHAATGAADDGVGVAAMMEAVRILKATGVKLRRTVRVGFWEGEEQGLIGSREYVSAHFAARLPAPATTPGAAPAGAPAAPSAGAPGGRGGFGGPQGPLQLKPEHDKLSVYLNIDNGTGALRGVYLQGNEAVAPIFREWMEPFRSMGMTTLTIRNTGGTDHQSFDAAGLPGFQFIQDEVEYDNFTHHTNLDTYERLQPNDVMKMSTIVAGFAYLAANRDEKLPRKPLPAGSLPAPAPVRTPAPPRNVR
jgi:carboxypeptidase Q